LGISLDDDVMPTTKLNPAHFSPFLKGGEEKGIGDRRRRKAYQIRKPNDRRKKNDRNIGYSGATDSGLPWKPHG
jgi:hypothetical protein